MKRSASGAQGCRLPWLHSLPGQAKHGYSGSPVFARVSTDHKTADCMSSLATPAWRPARVDLSCCARCVGGVVGARVAELAIFFAETADFLALPPLHGRWGWSCSFPRVIFARNACVRSLARVTGTGHLARLVRHVGLSSRSGPFVRAGGSQRTASGQFYASARIAHASQHTCLA